MAAYGSSLPSASIENDFLRLEYLTTTGPRIIGLYAKGMEGNLLAETPEVHWATPYGEYYLRGGHRLWIAPEDTFYIRPEGDVKVVTAQGQATLRGEVDGSGLEKEISFHLDQNRVVLTHQVTWHGKEPLELAPWSITQLRLGGIAILPLSTVEGLQPNRNLVLWPYAHVEDERFELCDDLVLLRGQASQQAFKIGNYNSHGWLACLFDRVLFVKRFSVDGTGRYPDMDSNVEVYVKDSCLELEALGPLALLEPKNSAVFEETWEVSMGAYTAAPEEAHRISKQLSLH